MGPFKKDVATPEEFIALFEAYGPTKTALLLGITLRKVQARRADLEKRLNRAIECPGSKYSPIERPTFYPGRIGKELKDGIIIVGSDAHYWPGYVSTAHRGLVHLCEELQPKIVDMNGDLLDGAGISRHPPLGWESKPSLIEELETVDERLDEIRLAAKGAELIWALGNHDSRFETYLANHAKEMKSVKGSRLCDHFPHWTFTWSLWVNEDVVIKHRFKGGIHATHNNTLWAGKTMVTGHLHSLKVTPFSDYNGTRFGVDSGTLNKPNGPHTAYTEENPLNHREGFIVLTFHNGKLLWPEIVSVWDEHHIQFRGKLIKV